VVIAKIDFVDAWSESVDDGADLNAEDSEIDVVFEQRNHR